MSNSYDPIDSSLPGSFVLGIIHTRILKWVAISYSKVSSQLRDQTCISYIGRRIHYHCYLGSPLTFITEYEKLFDSMLYLTYLF